LPNPLPSKSGLSRPFRALAGKCRLSEWTKKFVLRNSALVWHSTEPFSDVCVQSIRKGPRAYRLSRGLM